MRSQRAACSWSPFLLGAFEHVHDVVLLAGGGQVVVLGEMNGVEIAAFHAQAAETAGRKIERVFRQHLAGAAFGLGSIEGDAARRAGTHAGHADDALGLARLFIARQFDMAPVTLGQRQGLVGILDRHRAAKRVAQRDGHAHGQAPGTANKILKVLPHSVRPV